MSCDTSAIVGLIGTVSGTGGAPGWHSPNALLAVIGNLPSVLGAIRRMPTDASPIEPSLRACNALAVRAVGTAPHTRTTIPGRSDSRQENPHIISVVAIDWRVQNGQIHFFLLT